MGKRVTVCDSCKYETDLDDKNAHNKSTALWLISQMSLWYRNDHKASGNDNDLLSIFMGCIRKEKKITSQ